jgi:hypothetical protein
MTCYEILKQFLDENEEFSRVEWDGLELTVWWSDGCNPEEPWGIDEFAANSPTYVLMLDLQDELESADDNEGACSS